MDSSNIVFLGFADNKIPEFREVKSKDWIMYGEKNDFPEHLLYLYNKSSNHNAIINGKTTYIFGKGFENGNFPVNPAGETFNKVIKKFITDVELFGGGRIEVIWKLGGSAELRHIPFQRLRRAKEDNGFWHCKDWTKRGWSKENEPVFIPDYDPANKKGAQVFSYNEYRPGADVYPLPGYFGALNDIETDVEISKYNLSVIKNGMFSSKMIVFNDGKPTDEIKAKIEKDFKKKFAGSENSGNFMLVFNSDPAKAPIVQDLSTTDLDKLFDQLNKTTQGEIFSGHGVTSPMLFGIRTEGQLGGRSEIVEAYEIFKNTYVNEKQQAIEEVAAVLLPIVGQTASKIEPVEPINLISFTETVIAQNLTQDEIREKMGYDPMEKKTSNGAEQVIEAINSLSPLVANKVLESMTGDEVRALVGLPSSSPQPEPGQQPVQEQMINDNIKNLTGKQYQQLMRIIREFNKGKLTKDQATAMLRTGLGMTDNDINVMLGTTESVVTQTLSKFFASYSEDETAEMFCEFGESKKEYHVIRSMKFDETDMHFADLDVIDSNILDQIKKDKLANAKTIADAIKSTQGYVQKRINEMKKAGVLTQTSKKLGVDTIIETAINPEVIDYKPKAETLDVYVKYSYEVKPGAGPEIIPTSRPFCKKLIQLDRLYTRAEIETISNRLGYSVFDRGGGFWGDRPSCRHEWRRNLVIKKRVA